MKRIFALGALVVAVLFAQPPVHAQDEATKPAYKSGEFWVFTAKEGGSIGSQSNPINGTFELSIVEGRLRIAAIAGSQKEELDPRPATLTRLLGFGRNLDFPLTVGKQWSVEYKGASIGGKATLRKVTYEVKGIEQVTTAAGTFRAFRLESDDRGPQDFWTTTYWYSPETRSVVKSSFDGTSAGRYNGLKREIELIKGPSAK